MNTKSSFSRQVTERFLQAKEELVGRKNGTEKITLQVFAETVGMKASNVIRLEKAPETNFVTLDALGKLHKAYGISLNWLVSGYGDMMDPPGVPITRQHLDKKLDNLEEMVNNLSYLIDQARLVNKALPEEKKQSLKQPLTTPKKAKNRVR